MPDLQSVLFFVSFWALAKCSQSDPSGFVSVTFSKGQWRVIPQLMDWDEDHDLVARANFTNAQNSTGWMFLEVQTRETAPDQLQAEAAGIAEGYLTRGAFINHLESRCSTEFSVMPNLTPKGRP